MPRYFIKADLALVSSSCVSFSSKGTWTVESYKRSYMYLTEKRCLDVVAVMIGRALAAEVPRLSDSDASGCTAYPV